MDIAAQIRTDDYRVGKIWNELVTQIGGTRIPLLWQQGCSQIFYARMHQLEAHLGEQVQMAPEEWLWWKHGREQYGDRCREFPTRMPRGQDMTLVELYRTGNQTPVIMLIRWCIGGYLDGGEDYPIFQWAISRVDLTAEQSGKLVWAGNGTPHLIELSANTS